MEFRQADASQPPASELLAAMVAEIGAFYGDAEVACGPSATPAEMAPPVGAFLVGYDEEGSAVCAGGVKRLEDGVAEIKRMYVVPEARGRGAARALLVALEGAARELGYERVRLDTGAKQPHARALYEAAGYGEIPAYNVNAAASYWGEKRL